MSKMEPDEALNDRYKAIEDRLAVGGMHAFGFAPITSCSADRPQEAQPAHDAGREGLCESGRMADGEFDEQASERRSSTDTWTTLPARRSSAESAT